MYAVHRHYAALDKHFLTASTDRLRDDATRQTYRGLRNTLRSDEFILNLGLMMDSLSELTRISEALQSDDVTLPRAYQIISRTVRAFEKMKDEPAMYVAESLIGVDSRCYRNVDVDVDSHNKASASKRASTRNQSAINRNQFIQSMINNLESRLHTTIASNLSANSHAQSTMQNTSDLGPHFTGYIVLLLHSCS